MDYIAFCRSYCSVSRIPVTLMYGNTAVYSSASEQLDIPIIQPSGVFWETGSESPGPAICGYSEEIEYGCVHAEGTDIHVVLGPVFRVPVTDALTDNYMRENGISPEYREDVAEMLAAIPLTSRSLLMRHLTLLHMSLNHTDIPPSVSEPVPPQPERRREHLKTILSDLENDRENRAYRYDQQLSRCIRSGDTEQLADFLDRNAADLPEGCFASTPLRHAKDLFILTLSKAGMLAGIPGGIHADTVYRLTEMYIRECESLRTLSEVQSLQENMLLDLCRRCGESRLPAGLSEEVYRCLTYIQSHITQTVRVGDLCGYMDRSASYLNRLFRTELGMSVGECVTHYKLDRARSMLAYSELSLSGISCFLGFSSQSYFQNVFKKAFGITPRRYRDASRRH